MWSWLAPLNLHSSILETSVFFFQSSNWLLCHWWITTLLLLFAVPYYRDEKVSLEQQQDMKAKQRQTTKEEIRKIRGDIEEVCLSGLADDQN